MSQSLPPHLQENHFLGPSRKRQRLFAIQSRSGPFWGRSAWALLLGWLPCGDGGQLSPLAHCYGLGPGRRFKGPPFLHGPCFPGYCCFFMAGEASSRYTGRVWPGCCVSRGCCGLQTLPERMDPALRSSSRKAAPSGGGWGSPQVMAGDTGRLQLWRNRLLSPQDLITSEPVPFLPFPESLRLGPHTKPFHRWSQVRSTKPSTLQHKVLILGRGADVRSWPQAEGSPL